MANPISDIIIDGRGSSPVITPSDYSGGIYSNGTVTFYTNEEYYMFILVNSSNTIVASAHPTSGVKYTLTELFGLEESELVGNYFFENTGYIGGKVLIVQALPSITKQPSITSISPSSGTSTTISWSAATVSNQGSATIYYQYFVGPSSTYSDSYHVGTTTGLSATITESDILNKCGSSFDGTCYLFVRAYWQDGSTTGGWTTPTGSAFTYTAHRTVSYHDGSGWVECIVYYHDGSSWVECVPYYYSGGWIECSNS